MMFFSKMGELLIVCHRAWGKWQKMFIWNAFVIILLVFSVSEKVYLFRLSKDI